MSLLARGDSVIWFYEILGMNLLVGKEDITISI
jgi:hypothetical protein